MITIQIYTDGSCLNNQAIEVESPGGYGVVLLSGIHKKTLSGSIKNTTNIRAEMIAIIEGLRAVKFPCNIEIYTDSQLIVYTIIKKWKRNKNKDLWNEIDLLISCHNITWNWVRGHAGNQYNEEANTLAQTAASKLALELAK